MTERTALKAALGILHLPSSVRRVRSEPLPPGIETVLRIAAGDEAAETEAARLAERPRPVIREAAAFYIEQVLLNSSSDSYRALGATPAATTQELRRNMALLLSWLHPDKNASGARGVLAARVTGAWNDLRIPDRRAAYDAMLTQSARALRSHDPSRGSWPQNKIAMSRSGTGDESGSGHKSGIRNGKAQNTKTKTTKATRAMPVALRALQSPSHHSPHGRDTGLLADEHHSLLRRGWYCLRRVLRDRSTP